MKNQNEINFLIASIGDIQNTIRALDAKIIAIFVIILLPFTQIDLLICIYSHLINDYFYWGRVLLFLFVISWLISITFSFLCILSIDNPKQIITNDCEAKGVFYGSNLFSFSFKNIMFNSPLISKPSLNQYLTDFSDNNIMKELIFEQMKLVFIRDLKTKRQKITLISAFFSLCIIFFSWLIFIF